MQTNGIFNGLQKISTFPIARFNHNSTLEKPPKGDKEYFKNVNLNRMANTFQEFLDNIRENRDFVCGDRDWPGTDTGEWNSFYIDIDKTKKGGPIKNNLEYYRELIKSKAGVYPIVSWYSISANDEDLKQKHLMMFDTVYTDKIKSENYETISKSIKNLLDHLEINYDTAAYRPLRYCFAKQKDYSIVHVNDPENHTIDILKWRDRENIKKSEILEIYPTLNFTKTINDFTLEGIAKAHAKNNGKELFSYDNLLGVINWIRHIKQYDENVRDEILIPWIKSHEKDSEAALLTRIEKDFGSVPNDELEDFTSKIQQHDVFDFIYEHIKGKIVNEKFVKLLDIEGEAINIIRHYDLLDSFEIKEFKSLINRLNYVKAARIIELNKAEGEMEALEITDFIINSHNTTSRRPENSKSMHTGTFQLDFVKGINLITGVSHSGKSYLSIALSANLGYRTLYYSTDQDKDGFIQYCKNLKVNGGIKTGNLFLKNSMGTGLETISKEVEYYNVNCVVLDMINQIPIPQSEKMQDQELQRRQVEVLEELRRKYPDLIIVAIGSVPKGKDNGIGEVTLDTHTYGNNIVAHASDFIVTIANNKENNKFLKVLKDRYGDKNNFGRVGMVAPEFKKITDLLRVVKYV